MKEPSESSKFSTLKKIVIGVSITVLSAILLHVLNLSKKSPDKSTARSPKKVIIKKYDDPDGVFSVRYPDIFEGIKVESMADYYHAVYFGNIKYSGKESDAYYDPKSNRFEVLVGYYNEEAATNWTMEYFFLDYLKQIEAFNVYLISNEENKKNILHRKYRIELSMGFYKYQFYIITRIIRQREFFASLYAHLKKDTWENHFEETF